MILDVDPRKLSWDLRIFQSMDMAIPFHKVFYYASAWLHYSLLHWFVHYSSLSILFFWARIFFFLSLNHILTCSSSAGCCSIFITLSFKVSHWKGPILCNVHFQPNKMTEIDNQQQSRDPFATVWNSHSYAACNLKTRMFGSHASLARSMWPKTLHMVRGGDKLGLTCVFFLLP